MKTIFSFMLFGLISAASIAQQPILVTTQWLNEHKADPNVVILQVSFMKYEYDQAHIPGARFLWPEWLAPNSPYGNYNAPDTKKATEVLKGFGISNNSHVIIYYVRNATWIAGKSFDA
jgi:thiosulfate/3-mercaptopyruvate sulfurtransferase